MLNRPFTYPTPSSTFNVGLPSLQLGESMAAPVSGLPDKPKTPKLPVETIWSKPFFGIGSFRSQASSQVCASLAIPFAALAMSSQVISFGKPGVPWFWASEMIVPQTSWALASPKPSPFWPPWKPSHLCPWNLQHAGQNRQINYNQKERSGC